MQEKKVSAVASTSYAGRSGNKTGHIKWQQRLDKLRGFATIQNLQKPAQAVKKF